jgi:hypothetical protein
MNMLHDSWESTVVKSVFAIIIIIVVVIVTVASDFLFVSGVVRPAATKKAASFGIARHL